MNGRRNRYPDELLLLVVEYARGSRAVETETVDSIRAWCTTLLEASDTDEAARWTLLQFVGLAVLEVVKRRPGMTLTEEHARAYLESLDADESRAVSAEVVLDAFREVLELKISISNDEVVAAALTTESAREQEELAEALVSALRRDIVEIRMPRGYIEQLTSAAREGEDGSFELLRDGLFVELGLLYLPFRFVVDETLKPGTFASTVNHIHLLPRVGLKKYECLINGLPKEQDGRDYEIVGVTRNPATCRQASIVPLASRADAEADGFTAWNDLEFLVLSLAANLRQASACFVDQNAIDDELERLKWAFPALVDAGRSRISTTLLTRCVRALARERVSVRNLRLLLEELLELEHAQGFNVDAVAFDGDDTAYEPPGTEEWLRLALARQIQHQAARGTNTVVTYLLDPAIEDEVSSAGNRNGPGLSDDRAEAILDAAHAEMDWLESEAPAALVPDILTKLPLRRYVRDLLAEEFPRVTVVAHEELGEINVQPVARISLARRRRLAPATREKRTYVLYSAQTWLARSTSKTPASRL